MRIRYTALFQMEEKAMIIWGSDDPIIEDIELEDPVVWEARHCHYCGEPNDDTTLFRRGGLYHEACLQHMEEMGACDE